jgi:hypothetical protein
LEPEAIDSSTGIFLDNDVATKEGLLLKIQLRRYKKPKLKAEFDLKKTKWTNFYQ